MAKGGKNNSMITFQDGMMLDNDKLNQSDKSFRYGLNGRLIFNRDGTYSWETERGNMFSFAILPDSGSGLVGSDYIPLGWTGKSNLIVIFSVGNTGYGEIGIFIIDQNGGATYKTMFNDFNDPNGDSLNFNTINQIEARFIYETDNMLRAYWVDGVRPNSNQPRVFTFDYDNSIPENNVAAYSPVSLSVHEINLQSEFLRGIIKYNYTLSGGGNLLSGEYQYSYRLVGKTGYRTPFITLTNPIILSTDGIDVSNPWVYEMEGSGIDTGKAIEIQIKGIDERFDTIEVVYVYLESNAIPTVASIFEIIDISGDTMTFLHTSMDGEPLLIEELPVYFQGINKAKTLNIKDESLYIGNTIESTFALADLEPVLAGLEVIPYFKNIESDIKPLDDFLDGRDSNPLAVPPIAQTDVIASSTSNLMLHDQPGGVENYTVINEYTNYKGTQISHLHKGYWRGETYRFGIVFFDLLGYPSFVTHLFDMKTPEHYESTWEAERLKDDGTTVVLPVVPMAERAWSTCNYGTYFDDPAIAGKSGASTTSSYLRIMGIKVSGIDISTIKDQISGFMIVRAKCDNQIQMQGLFMPCCREADLSRPAPFGHDRWWDDVNGNEPDGTTLLADMRLLYGEFPGTGDYPELRPNLSVFYPPDIDFGYSAAPIVQTADRLKLVTTCFQPPHDCTGTEDDGFGCADYANQYFTWEDPNASHADEGRQVVRKLYYTKNDAQGYVGGVQNNPFPVHGGTANIVDLINMSFGDVRQNYAPGLDLHNSVDFEDGFHMGFQPNKELRAWGKGNSVFLRHGDILPFTGGENSKPWNPFFKNPGGGILAPQGTHMGSWIMNYTRPNNNPYGGITISSMERTIFYSTGHFQPVNNPTFDTQGMPATDIFDGIEVWGGDCILDYMGFLRLYGKYRDPANWNNDPYEFAIGEIFPLESRVHHPLRNAPSQENPIYSDVGARPQKEYEEANTNWPDGIYFDSEDDQLKEEFDINSVLFYEETVMLYAPKPLRFSATDHFPVRWRYTPSKFYGDEIDTWRIFQVNDYDDLNGEYGQITSSIYLFNQIYSYQESAFGRLRASDRALVETANQGSLTTGIGEKLDGIDYVNTEFGNQHQWALFGSGKAGYWVDVNQRKFCRFAQDGFVALSDTRGLHQWAEKELGYFETFDNPVGDLGITGIFDYQNNAAIWSFLRDRVVVMKISERLIIVSTASRVTGNNYQLINNLDQIDVNPTNTGNEIYVPINTATLGTNELFLFYINNVGSHPLNVTTSAYGDPLVSIGQINPGEVCLIHREHITDNWSITLITEEYTHKQYNSLSYNELTNGWQSFHSYSTNMFFNAKNFTLAYNINYDDIFWTMNVGRVGEYYGNSYNSILETIVSEMAMYSKAFDNFKGNVNFHLENTLEYFHLITDSTYNGYNLVGDTRKAYKENILRIPLRTENQLYRTRGKQLTNIMIIDNSNYDLSRISSIITDFRVSNRI